jgi:phosphopantothenoylcysteine decarboxylase
MNTFMYENFLTEKQRKILIDDFKFIEIPVIEKRLACGDVGLGAIANTDTIYEIIKNNIKLNQIKF